MTEETDVVLAARAVLKAWNAYSRLGTGERTQRRDRTRLEDSLRHLDDVVGYRRSLNVRHNRRLEEIDARRRELAPTAEAES